jgi:hypothetical protein
MNSSTTPHDQTLQRLPMYRLGLLSEADEEGCRLHLEACEACRAALGFMEDKEDAETGDASAAAEDTIHIPASILARWPSESARLRGAERSIYREHLASCATCTGALRMLGHPPALPVVPELEAAAPQWARIANAPALDSAFEPRPAQPRPVVGGRRFFSSRSTRTILAILAPVAAVIALIAVNPQLLRRPAEQPSVANQPPVEIPAPAPSPGETPPTASEPSNGAAGSSAIRIMAANQAEAIPELLASRSSDLVAMTVEDSLRGRVVAAAAGEFGARLEIPASLEGAASEEAIRAELLAPDDALIARGSFRVAELFPRKTLFVTLGPEARAGIYRLRLLSPAPGSGVATDTLVARYFIQPVHR